MCQSLTQVLTMLVSTQAVTPYWNSNGASTMITRFTLTFTWANSPFWYGLALLLASFGKWAKVPKPRRLVILRRNEENESFLAVTLTTASKLATVHHFYCFPTRSSKEMRRNRWCCLLYRRQGNDNFFVSKVITLGSDHFRKEDL